MQTDTGENGQRSSLAISRSLAMPRLWSALVLLVALTTHVGAFKSDPVFRGLNSVVDLTGVSVVLMIGIGVLATIARSRLPKPMISDLLVVLIFLCMLVGAREVSDPYALVKVATFALISLPLYIAGRILPTDVSETHFPKFLMAIGLYVQLTGVVFGTWSGDSGATRLAEGAGTHYLSMGYVAGSTAVVAWIRQREQETVSSRLVFRAIFGFSFIFLLLSAARGPFVALILSLLLSELLTRERNQRTIVGILLLAVFLVLLARSSVIEPMIGRFAGLAVEDGSIGLGTRGPLFSAAIRTIRSTPTGVGTGNFGSVVGTAGRDYPHNILLELGAEDGWFALATILLLVIVNARYAMMLIRRGRGVPIALLFLFALASAMFSGDINDHRLLWATIGAMQRIIVRKVE